MWLIDRALASAHTALEVGAWIWPTQQQTLNIQRSTPNVEFSNDK